MSSIKTRPPCGDPAAKDKVTPAKPEKPAPGGEASEESTSEEETDSDSSDSDSDWSDDDDIFDIEDDEVNDMKEEDMGRSVGRGRFRNRCVFTSTFTLECMPKPLHSKRVRAKARGEEVVAPVRKAAQPNVCQRTAGALRNGNGPFQRHPVAPQICFRKHAGKGQEKVVNVKQPIQGKGLGLGLCPKCVR